MELVLRAEPRAEDAEAVREILLSAGVFYPREIDVAIELVDDRLSKGRASEYFFVFADTENSTAGYICYGPITMTEDRFDIYWIAVKKQLRGRGIGGLLLHEAEKYIAGEGGKYIFVETSSRDVYMPTRQFYIRHGYKETARIPHYYADGDDKVIFMKGLS